MNTDTKQDVDPVTGYRFDQEIPKPICEMKQIHTDADLSRHGRVLASYIQERDHYKAHAERLAEALKECLAANSRDNYYDSNRRLGAGKAAREALSQWEKAQK